jgi:hypothetical protein
MRITRPTLALDSRLFGRRARFAAEPAPMTSAWADDLRLFAATFIGGFLFVSILIA